MKNIIAILIALNVAWSASANDVVEGKVVSVIDGNTVEMIALDQQSYKLLLIGIDCPELGQDYGEKAKMYLEKLVLNKEVTVTLMGRDRWGNRLAVVKIKGTKDPRVDLLKEGLAWTAEKDPDPELETHKQKAQQKGVGLWKADNPTPPWTFRRQQTMIAPKSL